MFQYMSHAHIARALPNFEVPFLQQQKEKDRKMHFWNEFLETAVHHWSHIFTSYTILVGYYDHLLPLFSSLGFSFDECYHCSCNMEAKGWVYLSLLVIWYVVYTNLWMNKKKEELGSFCLLTDLKSMNSVPLMTFSPQHQGLFAS